LRTARAFLERGLLRHATAPPFLWRRVRCPATRSTRSWVILSRHCPPAPTAIDPRRRTGCCGHQPGMTWPTGAAPAERTAADSTISQASTACRPGDGE
jgi:hypothetical protein